MTPSNQTSGLVTVMMPAHNAAAFVSAAIESLFRQTYSDWELVLVDDGSTDGTAEAAERIGDPRIQVFRQPRAGEAAARNRALKHARGEFLAFLDADDQFLADHLDATVGYLRKNPVVGGVYTDGYDVDEQGRCGDRLSGRRRGPFQGDIFEQLVRASDVFGPPLCVVLRTAVVHAHALRFDERIVIGPDWDFTIGYAEFATFGYLDQATCLYRVHPGSISHTAGHETRRASLAQCRRNAIQRTGFERCAQSIRSYAFYDLLVNQLTGFPNLQMEVLGWPQWSSLPSRDRARILRLAAGQSLLQGLDPRTSAAWFDQARRLYPADPRNQLLDRAHRLDPRLCRWLLQVRKGQAQDLMSSKAATRSPRAGQSEGRAR